jgi:glycosyltransferase involved in cell wall biosynthesis
MRVLQINTEDTKGGAAKVAYMLHRELIKRGHFSSMFVARKYSSDENIKLLNDSSKFINKIRRKLSYWLANDLDFFNSDKLLRTNAFKEADIIHCHNLHSNFFRLSTLEQISKLKPIIWTFHDMWPITAHCAQSFDGALNNNGFYSCPSLNINPPIAWHNEKYLEQKKSNIYNVSDFHIVTPSKWLADKVIQSVLKDKPLTVINNGIDTDIFKLFPRSDLDKLRSDLGISQNKKIILSLVKKPSDQWKGWEYVDQIITKYKNRRDFHFINIGRSFKNRTNFTNIPPISNANTIALYYNAADVFLYPSVADNCPLAVIEAQACGLPVVTFKTGGIPEIVEHKKTGYIAEYKNSDDLIRGLDYILNLDIHSMRQMSHSATQKIAQNFTVEKMVQKYLNLYSQVSKKPVIY